MKLESKLTEKDSEKISRLLAEVGAAWDATPDGMVAEHATLASVITELVAQRDRADERVGEAWDVVPDSERIPGRTLADVMHALIEDRDYQAGRALRAKAEAAARVDDRNATAVATVARREGYAAALDDIETAALAIPDPADAENRMAFLSGWVSGRRAGL